MASSHYSNAGPGSADHYQTYARSNNQAARIHVPREVQQRIRSTLINLMTTADAPVRKPAPDPVDPRGDPTRPSTQVDARPFMDNSLADIRAMIWQYFLPPFKLVPATSVRGSSKKAILPGLISILCTSKAVMDEVSMALYEKRTFEVRLDDLGLEFMDRTFSHSMLRDELANEVTNRFGISQLFGFSRIKHLKMTVETMFPQPDDLCLKNDNKYDIAMHTTVQRLVSLLCANHLKDDQKGLASLELNILSNQLDPDLAGLVHLSWPRQPQFQHSSKYDLACDFVLRPLTKLRGLNKIIIRLPQGWEDAAYEYGVVLEKWCKAFKEEVTGVEQGDSKRKRVSFDDLVVDNIHMGMMADILDERTIQRRYHETFGPDGGFDDCEEGEWEQDEDSSEEGDEEEEEED